MCRAHRSRAKGEMPPCRVRWDMMTAVFSNLGGNDGKLWSAFFEEKMINMLAKIEEEKEGMCTCVYMCVHVPYLGRRTRRSGQPCVQSSPPVHYLTNRKMRQGFVNVALFLCFYRNDTKHNHDYTIFEYNMYFGF